MLFANIFPIYSLSFQPFTRVFCRAQLFNFDEAQFIIVSSWIVLLPSLNTSPSPRSRTSFYVVFQKAHSFAFYGKIYDPFSVSFIEDVGVGQFVSSFACCLQVSSPSSTICRQDRPSPLNCFCTFLSRLYVSVSMYVCIPSSLPHFTDGCGPRVGQGSKAQLPIWPL